MKRTISLLLSFLLIFTCLTACSGKPVSDEAHGSELSSPPSETVSAPAQVSNDATASFYQYLKDTVIPEIGLAGLQPVTVDTDGFEAEHPALLADNGFMGLVSAAVRDFDGDGSVEMVTFTLTQSDIFYSWMREFIRDDLWLLTTVGIQLDLYAMEDGQVVHKCTDRALTWIDGLSWGPIAVGLEQYDGKIYIWGKAHSENTSTYGVAPFCISHVENGEFVRDYVDGMTWGQEDLTQEFKEVHTTHMNIRNTPLIDVSNAVDKIPGSSDKLPELFGDRMVLNVWLEGDWEDWGMLHAEAEDFTGLREILDGGAIEIAPLPVEPLVQPGADTDHAKKAEELVENLFGTFSSVNVSEVDSMLSCDFTLAWGNKLKISYNTQTDELIQMILSADDTESWYEQKDTILQSPEFGLDQEVIAPMLGECSMTKFSEGVSAGDYTVTILEVMSPILNIVPNR